MSKQQYMGYGKRSNTGPTADSPRAAARAFFDRYPTDPNAMVCAVRIITGDLVTKDLRAGAWNVKRADVDTLPAD